ncbi:hypothetical protein IWW36_002309 [Coemansia brasiliensis]|uniref:Uncharacterized protein n=1 Tax=Coemansia brasiliensis TaxID=2650707 RepID=A0A9W8M156_9FUNG|nr:hypothetical protein IWW36_002309 [Coemansia brasiliensis]
MDDFTAVSGTELTSGCNFRMGLKGGGFAVDSHKDGKTVIDLNTSSKFRDGLIFIFGESAGNLLIKVERRVDVGKYCSLGYLREEEGQLVIENDPVANVKLERYDDIYYNIAHGSKCYNPESGRFDNNPDVKGRSQLYFVKE